MEEKKQDNLASDVEELENKADDMAGSAENAVSNEADNYKEEIEKTDATAEKAACAAENTKAADEISEEAVSYVVDLTKMNDEAADNAEGTAEAAVTETAETGESYDPTVLKGVAPNSVPVDVKKKKPLNKTNVIVIVVCAVIVVACLIFVGFKVGWFDKIFAEKGKVNLCDLSAIEVVESEVEVTDDTVEYYVNSILSSLSSTEEVTDAIVDGDTANIDYTGVYAETGEEFEGGSSTDYDLTIGSDSFIDGFEDGLIGKKTGDTVELALRFPDDYSTEELAGKDVIFTVTINSVSRTTTPEYTDEWVQEYSAKYCPSAMSTTEEFDAYARETVEHYYLNNAIYQYILDNSEIVSYDSEKKSELIEYSNTQLAYYANMYGIDVDTYATYMGYDTADAYNEHQAEEYLNTSMIATEILKKQGIAYTDAEVDEAITQYLKDQRYIDYYTTEEFKEQSGELWVWLFENLQFKYEKAMESLYDNVVYVEEKTTTAEETTAAESTETTAETTETTAAN